MSLRPPNLPTTRRGPLAAALLAACAVCAAPTSPAAAQCPEQELELEEDGQRVPAGRALALANGLALLGSEATGLLPDRPGSVHVWRRAFGTWTTTQRLLARDGHPSDRFGHAVAHDGTLALVGAPDHATPLATTGAAYLFHRTPGGTWVAGPKLEPSWSTVEGQQFGVSAAVAGDWVAVGTWQHGAYVFHRDATQGWYEWEHVLASAGGPSSFFGRAVALGPDGERLVVSAPRDPTAGQNAGSVWVYRRTGGGFELEAQLLASDGAPGAIFGNSLDLAGDVLVVGALLHDAGGVPRSGAAYVFEREQEPGEASRWIETAQLAATPPQPSAYFGTSVATDGASIAVGESFAPEGGRVHVFERDGATWRARHTFSGPDTEPGDLFGWSVALDGESLLAGAPEHDAQQGTVYALSTASGWARRYCTTSPNSVGDGARIGHAGSLSLAGGGFTLTASGLPPGAPGLFYAGGEPGALPFGDGLRCVLPGIAVPIQRLEPPLRADRAGGAARTLDAQQLARFRPGVEVCFQLWYRNPGAGGYGFNLSDALAVGFCP